MFRTHVTSVCFVRNERDALEHAAVILTPFLHVSSPPSLTSLLSFFFYYILTILSMNTTARLRANLANVAT